VIYQTSSDFASKCTQPQSILLDREIPFEKTLRCWFEIVLFLWHGACNSGKQIFFRIVLFDDWEFPPACAKDSR
jgi:hypothetical protein